RVPRRRGVGDSGRDGSAPARVRPRLPGWRPPNHRWRAAAPVRGEYPLRGDPPGLRLRLGAEHPGHSSTCRATGGISTPHFGELVGDEPTDHPGGHVQSTRAHDTSGFHVAPSRSPDKTKGPPVTGGPHVELTGFEPVTPCMPCKCSARLSYSPGKTVRLPKRRADGKARPRC